jgi:hypothetical protein
VPGERTRSAPGHAGEADRCAEIEERLEGRRPELVARALLDPRHVRVHGEDGLAESLVPDRRSRVRPDARQLGQVVRPAAGRDRLRGPVQAERTPVVAQPLPLADHVPDGSAGERTHRRPDLEPAQVPRHDALDLRLLQHHLGDEDRVGIARPPPRQVTTVGGEPALERGVHTADRSRRTDASVVVIRYNTASSA